MNGLFFGAALGHDAEEILVQAPIMVEDRAPDFLRVPGDRFAIRAADSAVAKKLVATSV